MKKLKFIPLLFLFACFSEQIDVADTNTYTFNINNYKMWQESLSDSRIAALPVGQQTMFTQYQDLGSDYYTVFDPIKESFSITLQEPPPTNTFAFTTNVFANWNPGELSGWLHPDGIFRHWMPEYLPLPGHVYSASLNTTSDILTYDVDLKIVSGMLKIYNTDAFIIEQFNKCKIVYHDYTHVWTPGKNGYWASVPIGIPSSLEFTIDTVVNVVNGKIDFELYMPVTAPEEINYPNNLSLTFYVDELTGDPPVYYIKTNAEIERNTRTNIEVQLIPFTSTFNLIFDSSLIDVNLIVN